MTTRRDLLPPVGKVLRDRLRELGLSQRAAADLIGITPQHLSMIIAGRTHLTPSTAVDIGSVLDTEATWLLWLDVIHQVNVVHRTVTIQEPPERNTTAAGVPGPASPRTPRCPPPCTCGSPDGVHTRDRRPPLPGGSVTPLSVRLHTGADVLRDLAATAAGDPAHRLLRRPALDALENLLRDLASAAADHESDDALGDHYCNDELLAAAFADHLTE